MTRRLAWMVLVTSVVALALVGPAPIVAAEQQTATGPRLRGPHHQLEQRRDASGAPILVGTFEVPENRADPTSRTLVLDVVILRATGDDPAPDPVFWLAGGPGVDATTNAASLAGSWIRRRRDIVLMSQRGTGGSCRLQCTLVEDPTDPQQYLGPLFDEDRVRACRDALAAHHDLRMYATPIAMDDLDALRAALGYGEVNLMGGSYGTRAALVYLRRHPASVRTAILNGVAPLSFTNPLYHAGEAQKALDAIFAECAADPGCAGAFPDLAARFQVILQRLDAQPASSRVVDPLTGMSMPVTLSRNAFCETLRFIMYTDSRSVPQLVHRAFEGDYQPIAQRGVAQSMWVGRTLSIGMLLCVTCSEDVGRIDPETIPELTADTFMGDRRVREQIAACALWPKSDLPDGYGDPVVSDVPVLLLSGTLDPVTSPAWGEAAARHLSNSLHLVVPGSHGVSGRCLQRIQQAFLERGGIAGLDTSCCDDIDLGPFRGAP